MPDFFARLAARSAGLPGPQPRALPRLAHPFERAGARELEPEVTEVTAVRPATVTTAPASPWPAPVPSFVERHTETVHHTRELQQSATVVERNETTAVASPVHHVLERLEVPAQPLLVPVPVVGPAPAEVRAVEPAAVPAAAVQPAPVVPRRAWPQVVKAEQASAPVRRAAPEPERVVHVSIGRVEVKAAVPPAPAARRGSRLAPAVQLDKYLAREGS